MEKKDIKITCKDCGEKFIFTVREQEFYEEKGLEHNPVRCKTCRDKKKSERSKNSNYRK